MFFQVDGDGDEPEVGEEGLVEPVVAGGGPAAVLHAVEDAFGHVPPLARLPVAIPWGRAVFRQVGVSCLVMYFFRV